MSLIAERAYNSTRGNRAKETPEDRAYRLAQKYNSILRLIEQVNDARSFLQCRNVINAFAKEAGEHSMDVVKLNGKLTDRIKVVTQDTQNNIDRISAEIDKIKKDKFQESIDVLRELNVRKENKLLEIMLTMGNVEDANRRRLGNYVKNCDRVTALALSQMSSLPQYSNLFSEKMKRVIAENTKSEAEVVWERNKEVLLAEKSSQLGKQYMKSLNLRNALKKVGSAESYYFRKESE
ncbi:hypothetical protein [Bariatricus sp. HCP28S3_C2]|uniref:hypothetical protein n=1 Tax=unclassified Bariatricus TaxID=2677046 RepID=UPI003F8AF64A